MGRQIRPKETPAIVAFEHAAASSSQSRAERRLAAEQARRADFEAIWRTGVIKTGFRYVKWVSNGAK